MADRRLYDEVMVARTWGIPCTCMTMQGWEELYRKGHEQKYRRSSYLACSGDGLVYHENHHDSCPWALAALRAENDLSVMLPSYLRSLCSGCRSEVCSCGSLDRTMPKDYVFHLIYNDMAGQLDVEFCDEEEDDDDSPEPRRVEEFYYTSDWHIYGNGSRV